jgi:3-oxoacyl-[acyl-carrier protein] reductase
MERFGLQNKVVLVTGASGGIGSAICRTLAEEGAAIGICYGENKQAAEELKKELLHQGTRAITIAADMSIRVDVFNAVDQTNEQLGLIDILVNNAGITMLGRMEDITEEEWDKCLGINLKGVFFATQAVIPHMKKRKSGVIINITSLAAKIGSINASASYAVSKAGVSCLTIQTAKELLEYGVNVNAIAPGLIDTPIWKVYGAEKTERSFRSVVRGPGLPSDIADAVLFLASPMARYITGEILDVNGGLLMD